MCLPFTSDCKNIKYVWHHEMIMLNIKPCLENPAALSPAAFSITPAITRRH